MKAFRVWAPDAPSLALVVDGEETQMIRAVGGWWCATVETSTHEVDYGFLINGEIYPDPRSRRQPHGVHDRSRTFDASAYRWADARWTGRQLAGAIIYELHLGTFTAEGTLDAAIERLDHLVALGIDFVELLPVNAFNGEHNWGYDGVLWFAVHEAYGGPPAYQRFVDACHQRGLGVIQDVVYNHLGPSGNCLSKFGPYLHSDKTNTWGATVNLDGPGSDEVRRYIRDNAQMWFCDYHVDGLRLDAVHALIDSRALPLLEQLAIDADSLSVHLGRPLSLIAESDLNDPRLYTPRASGGMGLTAAWNDDFHHAVHVAVTGETSGYYADFATLAALAKVLSHGYFHDGSYSSFRGRHHGRPLNTHTTEPWRLVSAIQTHDQVGNRAAGERLATQADFDAQAIAAVLLLTSPFTPMLFMGEEWAASSPWQYFTSHPQSELGEQTRQGRLAEFARHDWDSSAIPDPQAPETFLRSKLQWDELHHPQHAAMFDLYRRLIVLRHTHAELTSPRWATGSVNCDEAARWILLERGRLVVIANLATVTQAISIPSSPQSGRTRLLLSTTDDVCLVREGQRVTMPPRCATVVERLPAASDP